MTYSNVQLVFKDRSNEMINVTDILKGRIDEMIRDVELLKSRFKNADQKLGFTTVVNADSTQVGEILKDESFTHVITSPPYPNRYSYVWNTRPYLFFFDYFKEPKQSTHLDEKCIGGRGERRLRGLQMELSPPQ